LAPFFAATDILAAIGVFFVVVPIWHWKSSSFGNRLPPLRRLDVFKTLFGFTTGLILLSAAAFPVLPDATRYAMGALKHSQHSCYFCYHLKTAPPSTKKWSSSTPAWIEAGR
jgi:hypothetical protein